LRFASDIASAAPIGVVTRVPDECSVKPLAAHGGAPARDDGSDVAEILILGEQGELVATST
jgi:hypothetical protein